MNAFSHAVVFAAAFGVCWFAKGAAIRAVTSPDGFVRSLKAELVLLKVKP